MSHWTACPLSFTAWKDLIATSARDGKRIMLDDGEIAFTIKWTRTAGYLLTDHPDGGFVEIVDGVARRVEL